MRTSTGSDAVTIGAVARDRSGGRNETEARDDA